MPGVPVAQVEDHCSSITYHYTVQTKNHSVTDLNGNLDGGVTTGAFGGNLFRNCEE
jgi:hypothetical protein